MRLSTAASALKFISAMLAIDTAGLPWVGSIEAGPLSLVLARRSLPLVRTKSSAENYS